MTKRERAKLRAAVMAMIRRVFDENDGRASPSLIIDRMFEDHPDLIDQAAGQLVRAALLSIVNSAFKQGDKAERAEMQINLFGNSEPALTIPKSIALPSPDGSREMLWVATTKATVSELDQYIAFLSYGIKADQQKRKQLMAFRNRVMELADTDDMDTPIRDMLEGLRAKTARAV